MRRLFELSTVVTKPDHHLRLNTGARSDLIWWSEYVSGWNGISWMQSLGELVPTTVSTDLGRIGCVGLWSVLGGQVVPTGMDRHIRDQPEHCSEGVDPNRHGSSNVGQAVAGPGGELQM